MKAALAAASGVSSAAHVLDGSPRLPPVMVHALGPEKVPQGML